MLGQYRAPRGPGLALRIDRDGIFHSGVFDFLAHGFGVLLAVGFRRVYADDRDALVGEVLMPARGPRVVANLVDSAEGPEMQHGQSS